MLTRTSKRTRLIVTLTILTGLLALASTVLAASGTATNNEPGFADDSEIYRSVSLDVPGYVTDVNVAVDFQQTAEGADCANPGTTYAYHSDLGLALTSPSGTVVNLVYNHLHPEGPTYGDPNWETREPVVDRPIVTFVDEASAMVSD